MQEQLKSMEAEALARLAEVQDLTALEEWRTGYLGRKGRLAQILRGLGQLPPEARPAAGQAANEVKRRLEAAFEESAEREGGASW